MEKELSYFYEKKRREFFFKVDVALRDLHFINDDKKKEFKSKVKIYLKELSFFYNKERLNLLKEIKKLSEEYNDKKEKHITQLIHKDKTKILSDCHKILEKYSSGIILTLNFNTDGIINIKMNKYLRKNDIISLLSGSILTANSAELKEVKVDKYNEVRIPK